MSASGPEVRCYGLPAVTHVGTRPLSERGACQDAYPVGVPRLSEYYHDPHAPLANSLAPTSFAVVRNAQGRVLLVQRIDTRNWELPGGKVNFGESALDTVVREVNEEAGILITVTGLAGIYTDPGHVMAYSNGEVRQQFAMCFHATPLRGDPRPDHEETINAEWVEPGALDTLPIHPSMQLRLSQAMKRPEQVHLI
ncbi:NUDIX domain-containing protein [Saccharopolyspora endophytica]|uniref:NUDIX domain-containing protein n=1 Tax=Saccharopolyspora endophytica TaxID=543886 RepID=UPI001FE7ACC1|nr:NUDIX domain-containing protein [Saccharopolyspora endophytica]